MEKIYYKKNENKCHRLVIVMENRCLLGMTAAIMEFTFNFKVLSYIGIKSHWIMVNFTNLIKWVMILVRMVMTWMTEVMNNFKIKYFYILSGLILRKMCQISAVLIK